MWELQKKKSWNFWCEKAKKFPVSRETKAYQKKKAVCYDAIRWFFVIYTTPLCFQRFNQSVEGNLDEENNEKSSVKQEMICFWHFFFYIFRCQSGERLRYWAHWLVWVTGVKIIIKFREFCWDSYTHHWCMDIMTTRSCCWKASWFG